MTTIKIEDITIGDKVRCFKETAWGVVIEMDEDDEVIGVRYGKEEYDVPMEQVEEHQPAQSNRKSAKPVVTDTPNVGASVPGTPFTVGQFVEDHQGTVYQVQKMLQTRLEVLRADGATVRGNPSYFRPTSKAFDVDAATSLRIGCIVTAPQASKTCKFDPNRLWVVIGTKTGAGGTTLHIVPVGGDDSFKYKYLRASKIGVVPVKVATTLGSKS